MALRLAAAMKSVRIVLANDHPMVRSSLRLLLQREAGFRVIAEAANAREATLLADYQRPDVVILDIHFSHISGISVARHITEKDASVRIVFMTELADEKYVAEAFKAGARAYVLSDSAQTDLIAAVHAAAQGNFFVSPGIKCPSANFADH
jgi:DNA-binding NarL/FixJ family response regulator